MNLFQQYLEKRIAEQLNRRRIVVWYDPRQAFLPFVDALAIEETAESGIAQTVIDGVAAALVRFQGSFFQIRHAVEPLVAVDLPEPLLIYIPGVPREKNGSVLMELEKGGHCFEWQLKSVARFCLREKFTDGVIDEMLASEKVTFDDIVRFCQQNGSEIPSVLRMVFADGRDNAKLIAGFLADDSHDAQIAEKGADRELFQLLESRIGLWIEPGLSLEAARQKTLRYLLANDFRADIQCDPPACIAMIPAPEAKEPLDLVGKVAQALRENHADAYAALSDAVAKELGLTDQSVDPRALGKVDTFRFEEAALLTLAGEQIREWRYFEALELVAARKNSFWVERDLRRQSQWEACRLMARLGARIGQIREKLKTVPQVPECWIAAYCSDDGWHRVDQAQHAMEAWVAKMDEEPDNEAALETVRQAYEDMLQEMANGFVGALSKNNWSVGGHLSQLEVYSAVVSREKTATAYFLVDAMRYAMATKLVNLLSGARDVVLQPAVGAWPTITPVGMAALLPGAESGFRIVSDKEKLAVEVDGTPLANLAGRMKFLKARVPSAVEMQLEKLLEMSSGKLGKTVSGVQLVVVRSQEIDTLGELAGNLVARQVMDTMVNNLARAVKKLSGAGIHRFVIAADHGHLFTRKKQDAFKTDHPGGKTLEIHRRCWIGQGGGTPPGTVRLSGPQIGYDTDLEFVFPTGIGVFKTGGDLCFHHGGLSLQEMIIPVLTFKIDQGKASDGSDAIVQLLGSPHEITNRTFGIQLALIGLFNDKPLAVRPILLSKGVIVGKAGMAVDAEYDQDNGDVLLLPGKKAGVAMILEMEGVEKVQVVIQDPATDRVLAQSKDIKIRLGFT